MWFSLCDFLWDLDGCGVPGRTETPTNQALHVTHPILLSYPLLTPRDGHSSLLLLSSLTLDCIQRVLFFFGYLSPHLFLTPALARHRSCPVSMDAILAVLLNNFSWLRKGPIENCPLSFLSIFSLATTLCGCFFLSGKEISGCSQPLNLGHKPRARMCLLYAGWNF